jgi:DNA (cytosine-5)-methyltransferase 1
VKPRLLDLFCGAGGAAMGYHRAGFDVVGVDLVHQPNYPFEFHQADALDVLESIRDGGHWLYEIGDPAAIHASPPCQAYGAATNRLVTRNAPRLIESTRDAIHSYGGIPYVVENVVGAPLVNPIILCGSSFGLAVKRHRLFECAPFYFLAPPCQHPTELKYPTHARKDKAQLSPFVHIYGTGGGAGKDINLWRWAMDVPWMQTKAEIAEAIPPAYTELIGHQLMRHLQSSGPQGRLHQWDVTLEHHRTDGRSRTAVQGPGIS